jgi:hypothetical protein
MKGDFTNFDEASRRHWESMSDPIVGPGQGIEAVKHLRRLTCKELDAIRLPLVPILDDLRGCGRPISCTSPTARWISWTNSVLPPRRMPRPVERERLARSG